MVRSRINWNQRKWSLYQKAVLAQPFDADVKGKAILESYAYYLWASKLDQLPDAKGKVKLKYTKDIKASLKDYYKVPQNLISYGASLYDKKNYEGALQVFGNLSGNSKIAIDEQWNFDDRFFV